MVAYGPMVQVNCANCNKEFERHKSEVARSKRLGRRQFCSRTCCGKQSWINIPAECRKGGIEQFNGKQKIRTKDEFSPFRSCWNSAKTHAADKQREFDITLQDLKNCWDSQNGKCPYTGWQLVNLKATGGKRILTPRRASLDRINSDKGYIKDNIQFISYMANVAKNKFMVDEFIEFCHAVAKHTAKSAGFKCIEGVEVFSAACSDGVGHPSEL